MVRLMLLHPKKTKRPPFGGLDERPKVRTESLTSDRGDGPKTNLFKKQSCSKNKLVRKNKLAVCPFLFLFLFWSESRSPASLWVRFSLCSRRPPAAKLQHAKGSGAAMVSVHLGPGLQQQTRHRHVVLSHGPRLPCSMNESGQICIKICRAVLVLRGRQETW